MSPTVATYDRLADEYDHASHETTRSLEHASMAGVREALELVARLSRVLELGCGTGTVTKVLSSYPGVDHVTATDPSPRMLLAGAEKLSSLGSPFLRWRAATAIEALRDCHGIDLVVASLADPYLNEALCDTASAQLSPGAHVFLSVPRRRWAELERGYRLGIPLSQTRFLSLNGDAHYAESAALEPNEFDGLLKSTHLRMIACGVQSGPRLPGRPLPEVSWALVRRSVVKHP